MVSAARLVFSCLESCVSTSCPFAGFVRSMDRDRRDLLNHLGRELAAILEDASADAALLPGVPDAHCPAAVDKLQQAVAKAEALASAMRAVLPAGTH